MPRVWRCMERLAGLIPPTKPAVPRRADWFRKKLAGTGAEGSGKGISGGGGRGVDALAFLEEDFLRCLELGPTEDARDDEDDVWALRCDAFFDGAGGR